MFFVSNLLSSSQIDSRLKIQNLASTVLIANNPKLLIFLQAI